MRTTLLSFLSAGLLAMASAQAAPGSRTVLETDFNGPEPLKAWSGRASVGPGRDGRRVALLESLSPKDSVMATREIPVADLRGAAVRVSVSLRAEDVGPKPNVWNGIKVMLMCEGPSGTTWPQATLDTGTFDWRQAGVRTRIPEDATRLTLLLGLELVTGKVWFDEVRVTAVPPPSPDAFRPGQFPPPSDLPRLRGVMISPDISAESLRVLGREWRANLIRWQLIRPGRVGGPASAESYDQWLEKELARLEKALPLCEEYGLRVVLDLHSPPGGGAISGGYVAANDRLFTDPASQRRFVEIWRTLAARFKGARPIWGFDLVNEPVDEDAAESCDDWQGLVARAAAAVRGVDPGRLLIIEPAQWGGPEGFASLRPLPMSNIVYSVHMYLPHAFTHQGVPESGPPLAYPGVIQGKAWDKAQLERALAPVVAFQQRYGVPIYVGEFSAIRWAPGDSARHYLADLIDIFEAHGWNWSYHAFREWQGWSVEHGSQRENTEPSATQTNRERLLRGWFARNAAAPQPPAPR